MRLAPQPAGARAKHGAAAAAVLSALDTATWTVEKMWFLLRCSSKPDVKIGISPRVNGKIMRIFIIGMALYDGYKTMKNGEFFINNNGNNGEISWEKICDITIR